MWQVLNDTKWIKDHSNAVQTYVHSSNSRQNGVVVNLSASLPGCCKTFDAGSGACKQKKTQDKELSWGFYSSSQTGPVGWILHVVWGEISCNCFWIFLDSGILRPLCKSQKTFQTCCQLVKIALVASGWLLCSPVWARGRLHCVKTAVPSSVEILQPSWRLNR